MLSQQERRTFQRIRALCPVKYFYLPPSPHPPETHILDLTPIGARIEVPDALIPGSVIAFQIITSERQVVDARARVVHVQPRSDAFYQAGVQFLTLSEDARARIAREIECTQKRTPVSEVMHDSLSQSPQAQTCRA